MKNHLLKITSILVSSFFLTTSAMAEEVQNLKEWTFLVFINGNNNLDRFGVMNMKQMEQVGSTDQVNIVVQYASISKNTTSRYLVQKSTDASKITSPVLEELGTPDMGDHNELYNFIEWGHKNFPAKKYFVTVWNHGNGWHLNGDMEASDISNDDRTGNKITTEQLGTVMQRAAALTGGKIELYGSDACLMSMVEVAAEMGDSVKYYTGSQALEPGEGWPYANFLARWVAHPEWNGNEVGAVLGDEFLKAYSGGVYGRRDVTFSTFDLSKLGSLQDSIFNLSRELVQTDAGSFQNIKASVSGTQYFTDSGYRDLGDFLKNLEQSNVRLQAVAQTKSALSQFVTSNFVSERFNKATGLSIWIPTTQYDFNQFITRYSGLKFHTSTHWGDFARFLNK